MSSLPGLPRLCSLGGGTRDGHFATGEVISRDSARTSRREAPVTKDLLQQLGLNVELATAERGTVTKGGSDARTGRVRRVECNEHRARLLRHDQPCDQPVPAYRRSHWLRT